MKFTTNGSHEFDLIPGRDYAIFTAGIFGGGTVSLTLADATLTGTLPMPDHGSITEDTSFIFTAPTHRLLAAVTGATAPDLVVDCILCPAGA